MNSQKYIGKVYDSNKKYHKVTKIEKEEINETVYNIEVEQTHNFYVGEQEVLVHNVIRRLRERIGQGTGVCAEYK